jgi:inner membrane transporter RhtA
MMCGSALSNQLGAASGALAFGVLGPVGVVAVRQWIAAIVLLVTGRPRFRSFTWAQWWPVLLLAVVYGTMNLSLYSAIDRLGLGLAVTLEFLGPLGVALATSRRRTDLVCALVAAAGVVALARPRPATDYVGIGLGVLAAACWAAYILLNRLIGRRLPGSQGSATAAGLSALVFVPIGIVVMVRHPPTLTALTYAAAAGILSSVVPLLADLFALRRVRAGHFGVFMSVNPVLAAVLGLVILGQSLSWSAWLSIAAIAAANVATSIGARRQDDGHAEDGRAGEPGRSQPLPQDERREDGTGERFKQGHQRGRAGGGAPQAAEKQRVGHGRRAGSQGDQQAESREAGPEAQPVQARGQRHQNQSADGEGQAGHGQVIQSRHRPGTGQGYRGEACRRQYRHARAGQHPGLAEPRRQAHEQAKAD